MWDELQNSCNVSGGRRNGIPCLLYTSLTDYLRCGFGEKQIACFYSGSTGLIELTPEQVDMIIIDNAGEKQDINVQKEISKAIRRREKKYITQIEEAKELLETVDKIWD